MKSPKRARRFLIPALFMGLGLAAHAETPLVSSTALYGALPVGESLHLSPDGNQLAMIAAKNGRRSLVVWHLKGGDPTVLTITDLEPQWLQWKSNTRLIVGLYTSVTSDSSAPYRRTYGIVFNAEGIMRLRNLMPGLDADPGQQSDQISAALASLPSDASQQDMMSRAMSAMLMQRPESADTQFQDGLLSLPPENQDRLLVEAWLPRTESGVVFSSDERVLNPIVWEKSQGNVVHWMADSTGAVRLKVVVKRDQRQLFVRNDDKHDDWRLIQTTTLDKQALFGAAVFADANLDREHAFVPLAFSETNPDHLFVSFVQNDGHLAIGDFDTGTVQMAAVVADGGTEDVTPVVRDRRLLGYRIGAGPTQYRDPVYAKLAQSIHKVMPEQDIQIIDVSSDQKRVLLSAVHGNEPAIYWMLDRHGPKQILAPALHPYEKVTPDSVAPSQWIKYPARDGLTVPALLTLPVGYKAGAIPFIVLIHDGPTTHDEPGFNWLTQFLISQGYGVLQPQFRGSTGFGVTYERAGDQEWGWKMQDDVTDGTQWLIHQGYADASRICIAGRGYGGYSALMGAVREPALYRCAAALDPLTNLREFVADQADSANYRDINVARIAKPDAERDVTPPVEGSKDSGGSEIVITDRKDPTPAELDKISPLFHASDISVPVLLVHGRKDYTVAAGQSEALEAALKKQGKPVQALYFDEADQLLQHETDRIAFLNALQNFLAANLKPPNPR